jgi:F-type H+-transporting ATPase subunit b
MIALVKQRLVFPVRERSHVLCRVVVAAAVVAAVPVRVYAEEHASEGGEHAGGSIVGLLFAVINFALFALIMLRYAWPIIRDSLRERRDRVVAALEAAKQARAEAEAIKTEFEAKMRSLEADAARARAEVLAIAEAEAKQLVASARLAAERIRADARLVAEQETARARRAIQEETAARIAEIAGHLIKDHLTENDQDRLTRDFLGGIRSVPSPGASATPADAGTTRGGVTR